MPTATERSYDLVAEAYTQRLYYELQHKPFDRHMLNLLAEKVGNKGVICDMGCGPGQVAAYLHTLGLPTQGIDLSNAMLDQARHLNPAIPFQQGDMLALTNIPAAQFGGIAAFYSIIHILPNQLTQAFQELWRILKPQGVLLVTFHIGEELRHLDEFMGQAVSLDFHFFKPDAIRAQLSQVGFTLTESIERAPYPPEIEVQTRRAYLFAYKP